MITEQRNARTPSRHVGSFLRLSILALASTLSGCAVWPSLKDEAKLEPTCKRPSSGSDLQAAYQCIEGARKELVDVETQAGYFNRAVAYTAVAGGTYAGYEATRTHPNHSLLKHAAIGIAALAGFSQVVDADQQVSAADAGIDALDCIRTAAEAVEREDVPTFHNNAVAFRAHYAPAMMVTPAGFTAAEAAGIQRLAQVRVVDLGERSNAFERAVATAKSTVAFDTYNAVLTIREEVRRQIATKKVDPTAVYKAQQAAVNKMVGDVADKSKEQQQAVVRVEMTLPDQNPQNTPTPGKAAQDAFHACVAPAPASGS
jgi:hypothetical protein